MRERAAPPGRHHESILLYGNDAVTEGTLKKQLESLGFHIAGITNDQQEALELVHRERPDLVITELQEGLPAEQVIRSIHNGNGNGNGKQSSKGTESTEYDDRSERNIPGLLFDSSQPSTQASLWQHAPFITGMIDAVLPLLHSATTELHLLQETEGMEAPEKNVVKRILRTLGLAEKLMERASWTTEWMGSSCSWISVPELIQEVAEETSSTLAEHQAIELYIPKDIPSLLGDRRLLKTALVEILRNALRYSGPTGIVTFRVEVQPATRAYSTEESNQGNLIFRITDTGPGFAPQELPRLMTPFYSTEEGRLGLGLAITTGIIHRHGGWIEVYSAENGGAEVRIYLPCCS